MNEDYGGSPLESLGSFDGLRIAILGIGNDINGDDASGVLIARSLMSVPGEAVNGETPAYQLIERVGNPPYLVVDGGPSPESFTGPLRRFAPDLVIMLDAAEIGAPPGTERVFDWQEASGLSASTHTMPPSMLAKYLISELNCKVALIGVQSARLDLDSPLSPQVQEAVIRVSNWLSNSFNANAS